MPEGACCCQRCFSRRRSTPKSTKGAVVGRPCAQKNGISVEHRRARSLTHSGRDNASLNMTAVRQALLRKTRMTPGGGAALLLPWLPHSASWCR